TPVKLSDGSPLGKDRRLQSHLGINSLQIGLGPLLMMGHQLVTGTVKTESFAKRDVKIERKGAILPVTFLHRRQPLLAGEVLTKLRCGGIRRITGAAQI